MSSNVRLIIGACLAAISLFGGDQAKADDAANKPMRWKSLTFRCAVAEGPKLEACAPLKAKGIDPRILAQSRLDVEGIPGCRLAGLTPGTQVDYPFSISEDPRFLELPRPLVVITNPDWAEPPPQGAIAQLYPEQALAVRPTAHVVVNCRVAVDGTAQGCKVAEEEPPGYGFGEAGIRAVMLMRFKPQMRDCTPTDAGSIRMPLIFRPPSSAK
jgi:TonB family protein